MNETLFQIVADTLGLAPADLSDETSMDNTPAWDSVAHLNLVISLEQSFGVKFGADEFMGMRSIAEIRRALAAHGAA